MPMYTGPIEQLVATREFQSFWEDLIVEITTIHDDRLHAAKEAAAVGKPAEAVAALTQAGAISTVLTNIRHLPSRKAEKERRQLNDDPVRRGAESALDTV